MNTEQLLKRIKALLEEAYGDRLEGVVLYGSEARGEADVDSDIDVLVILKGPVELWRDIRTNIFALYDLQLELERPIHAKPVDVEAFRSGKYALFRNAIKEGISA